MLLPHRHASLERSDDLLGGALVEWLRIVPAAGRGERAGGASLPHAGERCGIAYGQFFNHDTRGNERRRHRRAQFLLERVAERRLCQQDDVEQPDIDRVIVRATGFE